MKYIIQQGLKYSTINVILTSFIVKYAIAKTKLHQ